MPWRETADPYRIWLSEIMLQQTQVAAVRPYYDRFLAAFPDVFALAATTEDAVLKQWEGLGYYSRARNLRRCAGIVVREFGGRFPEEPELLGALPGIGRSTAGAIAAIAFGRDAAVLDGNVRRVASRLVAEGGDPARAATAERLWAVSRGLVAPGRGRDTALAMMDLGAVVCTPRRPRCPECPMAPWCRALASGRPEAFPAKAARPARPGREAVAVALLDRRGRLLVRRREGRGLLGGLWELPGLFLEEGESPEAGLSRWFGEAGVGDPGAAVRLATVRHGFTHFVLHLHGWRCRADRPGEIRGGGRWMTRDELSNHAFPKAHRMLVEKLREEGT